MNRLTTKIKGLNNYCEFELKNAKYKDLFELSSNREIENYVNADLTIAVDKLGKLEDIEEELGIDLITLFNIISGKQEIYIEEELFKNTCWGKYWKDVKCFICISFSSTFIHCDCWDEENFHGRMHTEVIPLKEYGKTWALTREELENE